MAKTSAIIFGIILVIVGIWGFFAPSVLGFIAADNMSSVIHIVLGLVLLILSSKPSVGMALKIVGIIYIIFGILGFIGGDSVISLFVVDSMTTWFYLIVGVVVALLGFMGKKDTMSYVPPQM